MWAEPKETSLRLPRSGEPPGGDCQKKQRNAPLILAAQLRLGTGLAFLGT
jgi:hypothetical protein